MTLQGKAYGHESRRNHRAWMVISFHPMVFTFGRELGRCVLRSFYNACIWPALGDLTYFLTVNVLAPTVTKWNKACDQKVGTIEKIHQQTKHYRQHGFVVRTATLDYFRTLLLTETCKIPINIMWMCFMCIWITNICFNFLNVQETNSSVSQECRIRNNFFGRRLDSGGYTNNCNCRLCFRNICTCRCFGEPYTLRWQTSFVVSFLRTHVT